MCARALDLFYGGMPFIDNFGKFPKIERKITGENPGHSEAIWQLIVCVAYSLWRPCRYTVCGSTLCIWYIQHRQEFHFTQESKKMFDSKVGFLILGCIDLLSCIRSSLYPDPAEVTFESCSAEITAIRHNCRSFRRKLWFLQEKYTKIRQCCRQGVFLYITRHIMQYDIQTACRQSFIALVRTRFGIAKSRILSGFGILFGIWLRPI